MELLQIDAKIIHGHVQLCLFLVYVGDFGASESSGCRWVKMVQLVPTQDL